MVLIIKSLLFIISELQYEYFNFTNSDVRTHILFSSVRLNFKKQNCKSLPCWLNRFRCLCQWFEYYFLLFTYFLNQVCKDFDCISQRILNRGFQRIERRISSNLKAIKVQLPRRESERRYVGVYIVFKVQFCAVLIDVLRFHPLSRHCDILTSVETRISMLNMAYNRFIEQGKCCFIPGKVKWLYKNNYQQYVTLL